MMNVQEPEISLYAYWPDKAAFDYPCEQVDAHVLFFVEKGSFEYRFNSERTTRVADEGMVVFCPGGTGFHRRALKPMSLHVMRYADLPIAQTQFSFSVRALDSLTRMRSYHFLPTLDKVPLAQHYCRDVLYELYLHSKHPEDMEMLLSYIDGHLHESISNEALCRILCCCESTLIARFRHILGLTPQQYITQRRLQFAKQELLSSNDSLQQIAHKYGYDDPLYFSRIFTRHFGIAPTQYRRRFML